MASDDLGKLFADNWPKALAVWSPYIRLPEPIICADPGSAAAEGAEGAIALIRLTDLEVVVNLEMVRRRGLGDFPLELLSHEVGHHVYTPANLTDNGRLMARILKGLPTKEQFAPMIANMYSDILINDRLQRLHELNMAGVYARLKETEQEDGMGSTGLWQLYMRIFERLWSLPGGSLTSGDPGDRIEGDADLGARLVRVYARDWLDGAGRFACLCLPYLERDTETEILLSMPPWFDTVGAGGGEEVPDGLSETEAEEEEGAIHPSLDPALSGLPPGDGDEESGTAGPAPGGKTVRGGAKSIKRDIGEYIGLMKALAVKLPEETIVARYYRELALPHLVPFPSREMPSGRDPLPEGFETWDGSSPLQAVDWFETVMRSPVIIPGATTVERRYGSTEGELPEKRPFDLYVGIDCSGSMTNPAVAFSPPVLAGTILTLSAFRAGARVMACLSGEAPGAYTQTAGFIRDEDEILSVLTGYLGTGYSFGIERLRDTFLEKRLQGDRPTHILVVSDGDLLAMCQNVKDGWSLCEKAAEAAGGGATACLEIPGNSLDYYRPALEHLEDCGWYVHVVTKMSEVVSFARKFSRDNYGEPARKGRR